MKKIEAENLPLYRRLGIAIAALDGIESSNPAAVDRLIAVATQAYAVLEWLDEMAASGGKFGEMVRLKLESIAPVKRTSRTKYVHEKGNEGI